MIGDLLEALFEGFAGRERIPSKRGQIVARLFFGLLGTSLAIAGFIKFATESSTSNVALQASMLSVFIFLACFCLFNVILAHPWRWPGRLLLLSFVMLFVTRILFGV